jgi:glyoxylase-like metal-dependent hydrolase (beta-lactamase superfamily II)
MKRLTSISKTFAMAARIFGCLLTLILIAYAADDAEAPRQLAPGVYVFPGNRDKREPANLTLVIFKDFALVADGNFPWGARERLPKIKALTGKPVRFVFDTHYHGDHSYGNSIYVDQGATVVLSQATDEELRTKGQLGWTNWKEAHSLAGARLEAAQIVFSDAMAFDDGEQRVELIRVGPGHTKGDSVAYLPKLGIVVTGDLCVTWPFGNNVADADADYRGWLRALDRIAGWNIKTVVPGHGPVAGPEALTAQKAYLSTMLNQVETGIRAGKTADDLVREINLSTSGTIASSSEANAASIRAMYKHLKAGKQ